MRETSVHLDILQSKKWRGKEKIGAQIESCVVSKFGICGEGQEQKCFHYLDPTILEFDVLVRYII